MSAATRELILQRINKHSVFPNLPIVAFKLNEIVNKESVTYSEIENIITKDPVSTAKLLKIVNCSFYGFPQKISTISKAALILGFNVIRTIIITTPMMEAMKDIDVALWEHATCCALCSGLIAKKKRIKNPEEVSTAALIQNIGFLFIRLEFPLRFFDIMKKIKKENISLLEAETSCLGINHAEIGAELARLWNLPPKLVEAIRYHHVPSQSKNYQDISSVIHFSDILVSGLGVTSSSDIFVPPLDKPAWDFLQYDQNELVKFLEDDESKMLWDFSARMGEEFLKRDTTAEEDEKARDITPIVNIKKKLTFLQKRFAKVADDPVLVSIMKIIAKHYIEEEKAACQQT